MTPLKPETIAPCGPALCEACGTVTSIPLTISPKAGRVTIVWTCDACAPVGPNVMAPIGSEEAWRRVIRAIPEMFVTQKKHIPRALAAISRSQE